MKAIDILILTDHQTHNQENSVYPLINALRRQPEIGRIFVASRGNSANRAFFYDFTSAEVQAWRVSKDIEFRKGETFLVHRTIRVDVRQFDAVWLRLPRPIPDGFFEFLPQLVDEMHIVNRPSGIAETGNKAFLQHFPEYCPPLRRCTSVEEIREFQSFFPIVLKPLESYGGKGIVKIHKGKVYVLNKRMSLDAFLPEAEEHFQKGGYLAMKYLKNVRRGDKRILVVNRKVLGAVLRIPPKGSWMCNAALGGQAFYSEPDHHEMEMAEKLSSVLYAKGVIFFGMDTLQDDNGRRVLSEINVLSIGGVKQMAELSGRPVIGEVAALLAGYLSENLFTQKSLVA